MTVSVRSYLAAGLAAATLSAAAVVPVTVSRTEAVNLPSIELSAAVLPLIQPAAAAAGTVLGTLDSAASSRVSPAASAPKPIAAATSAVAPAPAAAASGSLGNAIINTYSALQPWVAWGFELADWALSFVPGLWWIAPAIDLAYFTAEPIVQSLVYSFAYLIDGQPALIGPTIQAGLTQAAGNFVTYSFYWFTSLIPLPPLPPFPVFPVASVAPVGASVASVARGAARVRSAAATPETTAAPIEALAEQLNAAVPSAAKAPFAKRGVERSAVRATQAQTGPAPQAAAVPNDVAPQTVAAKSSDTVDAPVNTPKREPRRSSPAARSARSADRNG